jgi:hypothetical protein
MNRLISPFLTLLLSCCLWLGSWTIVPPALAVTQIPVSNIDYHDCPADVGEGAIASGSSMTANCFIITGTANNTSGKPVMDADIFGRIYDANGNSVMQNRTRLGGVPEIPPGESTFEIRISVPENQPTPLKRQDLAARSGDRTRRFVGTSRIAPEGGEHTPHIQIGSAHFGNL